MVRQQVSSFGDFQEDSGYVLLKNSFQDLREELKRLRRENRILREEREILKKAAAFFAKEDGTR